LKLRDRLLEVTTKYCDDAHLAAFSHKWSVNGQTIPMWNVIGTQNWKDSDERVVILTHWDTRPTADYDPDPASRVKPIPGADDGASGTAILEELMRVMKGRHPRLGIMYLFIDGEDLGPGEDEMFLGAIDFAHHLPNPRPDYGVLLDMVGQKNLVVPVEPNSFQKARPLVSAFYRFAGSIGYDKSFPTTMGTEIEDDHLSLIEAGVPTMDLIDFDYPSWHTLQDTPDKCSPESLGIVGRVMESWLCQKPPFVYPN
jgi:Zn-dependent M28 family amino/carboxypeptidase